MNEKQKRIAIIIAVIVMAIILFMRSSKGEASQVVNDNGEVALDNVSLPGVYIPERRSFTLPAFNVGNSARDLSAIGACCADCRPSSGRQSFIMPSSGNTFVTNLGNAGANVFNYYQPSYANSYPVSYRVTRNA